MNAQQLLQELHKQYEKGDEEKKIEIFKQAKKQRARRLSSLIVGAYGIEFDQGKFFETRGEMAVVASCCKINLSQQI